jgi:hypothetical protein
MMNIPDRDLDFLFFIHPGSRIQGSKRHRIPHPGSAKLEERLTPGSPTFSKLANVFLLSIKLLYERAI